MYFGLRETSISVFVVDVFFILWELKKERTMAQKHFLLQQVPNFVTEFFNLLFFSLFSEYLSFVGFTLFSILVFHVNQVIGMKIKARRLIKSIIVVSLGAMFIRAEYTFLELLLIYIVGLEILNLTIHRLSNIGMYYLLLHFGYNVKPVIIYSKGYSITSHWCIAIDMKSYEIFKKVRGLNKEDITDTHVSHGIVNSIQKTFDKRDFDIAPQRRDRKVEWKFRNLFFVPFIQKGLIGYTFETHGDISKRIYTQIFNEQMKDEYQIFWNDCQIFCQEFALRLGIRLHSSDARRFMYLLCSTIIVTSLKYTILYDIWGWIMFGTDYGAPQSIFGVQALLADLGVYYTNICRVLQCLQSLIFSNNSL